MAKRDLRNAALGYADRGWKVFPLYPRQKAPHGRLVPNNDEAGTPGGHTLATDNLAQVFTWWTQVPYANIGISCGPSGLIVLDVDPRNGGEDTLYDLERDLGNLPPTVEAHTGGDGRHILFTHPGVTLRGKAGEGLDIKDAGYIVAPPSIHPSGKEYVWSVDGDPDDVSPVSLPAVWVARLQRAYRGRVDLSVSTNHADPLRNIPSATYAARLTGREIQSGGWMQCPFHKGGNERTPSFNVRDTLWACYGCDTTDSKTVMGGNIYELAARLWGYALPLRGVDFIEVKERLTKELG